MSYHAAISPLLAAWAGVPPNDTPHIACDTCGDKINVAGRKGPHSWFLNCRNPPGTKWIMRWPDDGTVEAWCPKCSHLAPRKQRSPRPEPRNSDNGGGKSE